MRAYKVWTEIGDYITECHKKYGKEKASVWFCPALGSGSLRRRLRLRCKK